MFDSFFRFNIQEKMYKPLHEKKILTIKIEFFLRIGDSRIYAKEEGSL